MLFRERNFSKLMTAIQQSTHQYSNSIDSFFLWNSAAPNTGDSLYDTEPHWRIYTDQYTADGHAMTPTPTVWSMTVVVDYVMSLIKDKQRTMTISWDTWPFLTDVHLEERARREQYTGRLNQGGNRAIHSEQKQPEIPPYSIWADSNTHIAAD
jgi:hypothetical protein